MSDESNKLPEALSSAVSSLYRLGGLMLVFIFVGTLTMVGGNAFGGPQAGLIVGVGALVTITCLGLFALTQMRAGRDNRAVRDFATSVIGRWWEQITPNHASALSFVQIETDQATGNLRLAGNAFDVQGNPIASWQSVATCLNVAEKKLFYYWRGRHPAKPSETHEGFGEITFEVTGETLSRADGVFCDANLHDLKNTLIKAVILRRSIDPGETAIMHGANREAVAQLVRTKLQQLI